MSLLRRIFRRFGWVHLITLGLLAALIVLRAADPAPLQLLRSKVFDFYQQIEPREVSRQPVAIIDLDEEIYDSNILIIVGPNYIKYNIK